MKNLQLILSALFVISFPCAGIGAVTVEVFFFRIYMERSDFRELAEETERLGTGFLRIPSVSEGATIGVSDLDDDGFLWTIHNPAGGAVECAEGEVGFGELAAHLEPLGVQVYYDCRVEGEVIPEAVSLGGGWIWADWIGAVYASKAPWLYSPEHGWIYIRGSKEDEITFYGLESASWFWADIDDFPQSFNLSLGVWGRL